MKPLERSGGNGKGDVLDVGWAGREVEVDRLKLGLEVTRSVIARRRAAGESEEEEVDRIEERACCWNCEDELLAPATRAAPLARLSLEVLRRFEGVGDEDEVGEEGNWTSSGLF